MITKALNLKKQQQPQPPPGKATFVCNKFAAPDVESKSASWNVQKELSSIEKHCVTAVCSAKMGGAEVLERATAFSTSSFNFQVESSRLSPISKELTVLG